MVFDIVGKCKFCRRTADDEFHFLAHWWVRTQNNIMINEICRMHSRRTNVLIEFSRVQDLGKSWLPRWYQSWTQNLKLLNKSFKMNKIWAKSINIWLKYDKKLIISQIDLNLDSFITFMIKICSHSWYIKSLQYLISVWTSIMFIISSRYRTWSNYREFFSRIPRILNFWSISTDENTK